MTRALYLNQEDARTLELAARYLRSLRDIEYAHAVNDLSEIDAVLGGIDPVDVRIVQEFLEELRRRYVRAPIRIETGPRAIPLTHAEPSHGNSRSRSDEAPASSPVSFHPESRRA